MDMKCPSHLCDPNLGFYIWFERYDWYFSDVRFWVGVSIGAWKSKAVSNDMPRVVGTIALNREKLL